MYKKILNSDGSETGIEVNENCEFRNSKTMVPLTITRRKDGRPCVGISIDGNKNTKLAYRVMMRTFYPDNYSEDLVINHLDGDTTNNNINNLEITTQALNMKHAGQHNLMPKGENHHNSKYKDKIIHKICEMKIKGISRQDIKTKLDINTQLIDDVCAGRSHKDISSQYINQGFEYSKYNDNRNKKLELAEIICQLWIKGYKKYEIINYLDIDRNFVDSVINKVAYKYISDKYF